MTTITCRLASAEELETAQGWALWESGDIEQYSYRYEQSVQYVVQSGEAVIHSADQPPIAVSAGSHVTIGQGQDVRWQIKAALVNRYQYC